jgi:hypothetical protein
MNRYALCERCTVRNCRKTPKAGPRQTYTCRKRRELSDGWPMLELALDSNPADTLTVVHKFGGKVNETKKGYRISWSHSG